MRLPKNPPNGAAWIAKAIHEGRGEDIFNLFRSPEVVEFVRSANDRYLHWDRLRYQPMPDGLEPEAAWAAVQQSRIHQQPLQLTFENKKWCSYWLPPQHQEWVSLIDRRAAGNIGSGNTNFLPEDKERYLINSLMEEAIASSQIEGACTTREVGKELLRTGRQPRDTAEQMIVNNYRAILEIREVKNNKLTPELLCHLQELLTQDTMDEADAAGRFRKPDEDIHVADVVTGEPIYTPPPADTLGERVRELCAFANAEPPPFIHPVVKAMALHFAIGFIHPFVDGNGRTARALFYWYMLKSGYWLFEYLPISRIIVAAPKQYALAYLYTESDRGDLTYFNHYHLEVVVKALNDLHEYLAEQQRTLAEAVKILDRHVSLNHRQRAMMGDLLKRPTTRWTIQEHQGKYRVTYNTARTDLQGLEELGLLSKEKRPAGGKGWIYQLAPDVPGSPDVLKNPRKKRRSS